MKQIKDFFTQKKWTQIKKGDWIVLALVGVLVLIIAMPTGNQNNFGTKTAIDTKETETAEKEGGEEEKNMQSDDYTAELEHRLEQVLTQMEGVGKVSVMITIADAGENVVEKDRSATTTTTTESDGSGGSRTVTESQTAEGTIYRESGDATSPYIQKEKMPTIAGVMVVAEGGGNARIASDISEAVLALFPVEAHKIKVVKMCSKEE